MPTSFVVQVYSETWSMTVIDFYQSLKGCPLTKLFIVEWMLINSSNRTIQKLCWQVYSKNFSTQNSSKRESLYVITLSWLQISSSSRYLLHTLIARLNTKCLGWAVFVCTGLVCTAIQLYNSYCFIILLWKYEAKSNESSP